MSIATEINRIKSNIADAAAELANSGIVTASGSETSADLVTLAKQEVDGIADLLDQIINGTSST